MRKLILAASLLLLMFSAVFGYLNSSKIRVLRTERENAEAARLVAENARAAQRKEMHGREAKVAAATAKSAETEARMAQAEAEAVKAETEKGALQAKLQANQTQLADLQKRVEELAPKADAADVGSPSALELQAQLDETRKQLDSAEREKNLLAERIHGEDDHVARPVEERPARHRVASPTGVHGTVMAVNQAYNFVVLNLGGRQGVEPNAEMLVVRAGTLIGKIRVSSVEPATAIGDIISSSLARGVQVQPGDTVIYAGSDS